MFEPGFDRRPPVLPTELRYSERAVRLAGAKSHRICSAIASSGLGRDFQRLVGYIVDKAFFVVQINVFCLIHRVVPRLVPRKDRPAVVAPWSRAARDRSAFAARRQVTCAALAANSIGFGMTYLELGETVLSMPHSGGARSPIAFHLLIAR